MEGRRTPRTDQVDALAISTELHDEIQEAQKQVKLTLDTLATINGNNPKEKERSDLGSAQMVTSPVQILSHHDSRGLDHLVFLLAKHELRRVS